MFTLIKREIYDHVVYFAGAIVLSLIMSGVAVFLVYYVSDIGETIHNLIGFFIIPAIIVLLLGSLAMGVSQMYQDRNKKVSSFLSTHAASRDQIIMARISSGILIILLFFVPHIITTSIIYKFLMPYIVTFEGVYFFDVYTVTLLTALSCYCIGLQTGWKTGRLLPALAALPYAFIFTTIIIIKGFGIQTSLLLILFVSASLVRIRQNFISTSL
jgi:hypothetical protein